MGIQRAVLHLLAHKSSDYHLSEIFGDVHYYSASLEPEIGKSDEVGKILDLRKRMSDTRASDTREKSEGWDGTYVDSQQRTCEGFQRDVDCLGAARQALVEAQELVAMMT